MKTIKISQLSENLQGQLDMVAESDEAYKIPTGNGDGEGVVIMSLREYNSWKEKHFLLSSETDKNQLLESIAQVEKGETVNKEPGQLWASLTDGQKREVMLSYEDSESAENLIHRNKVFGKVK